MAMDDAGDKLLGGQISGAGVIAWDDPMSRSGTGNTNDWTLHVLDPSSMVIHAGRLYVGCWNPPYIQIWDDISSITEPAPPHATMASGSGLVAVWHLSLRDDVLAACTRWMDTAKVNIYLGAGSLSGDGTPDFEITHSLLDDPKKAYLGADETLYVMDGEGGILIFRDALSAPALATELTAPTKPSDFLLRESW
jgi:hypothetical protein